MAFMPYFDGMKMTMHIDEDILDEVVRITGAASKTKAVEAALTTMVRRHKLYSFAEKGLGLTKAELRDAWEDPVFDEDALRVAEEAPKRDRKRSRR